MANSRLVGVEAIIDLFPMGRFVQPYRIGFNLMMKLNTLRTFDIRKSAAQ